MFHNIIGNKFVRIKKKHIQMTNKIQTTNTTKHKYKIQTIDFFLLLNIF